MLASSMWPATPLAQRHGFAEAMAFAEATTRNGTGGFVVVWPPSQAAALAELPASLTAADAVPIETEGRRRYLRILVVGPAGFDDLPELADAPVQSRRRFGDVEVATHVYEGGDRVAWDLRDYLRQARVSLSGPEWNIACDAERPDGGWGCPGRPQWNHVGPTSLTVDGRDWDCVWAHPLSLHRLVIDLGELELWDRIEVEIALSDDAVSLPGGASVTALLEVDGVGTRRLMRSNGRGIARVSMPTQRGTKAAARLVITTGNDGRRHIGVNVRIVVRQVEVRTK
ncbi:MAG: hypothetical protein V3T05_09905 [Myxococcota bacterium]